MLKTRCLENWRKRIKTPEPARASSGQTNNASRSCRPDWLGRIAPLENKFNAALVLQHTPLTYCDKQLVSKSPDNYLLAHNLFKSAFEAGYKDADYLVVASIDRYLSFTEGYQKYGTNRIVNQETGKEELVPIDRKTPDSERAKYGVPPLATILKQFPEQAPRKKSNNRINHSRRRCACQVSRS